MRILVTGVARFMGSHVVDSFIEAGHHVIMVDNLSTGRRSNLNPRATFYEIDVPSPALSVVFEQQRSDVFSRDAAQWVTERVRDSQRAGFLAWSCYNMISWVDGSWN